MIFIIGSGLQSLLYRDRSFLLDCYGGACLKSPQVSFDLNINPFY